MRANRNELGIFTVDDNNGIAPGQATESKKLTNTVQYYSFLVLK
jgi:hypothetical protein